VPINPDFRLSVAIPLHNEESVLPELLKRLQAVLDALPGGPHEIVFVDDGSTDRTFELLEAATRQDPRILVLSLSRNFGHQTAITAALDHLTGDAAVVMDGDLQDVPEVIPQFVQKFQEGFDVVYAKRVRRKEPWPLPCQNQNKAVRTRIDSITPSFSKFFSVILCCAVIPRKFRAHPGWPFFVRGNPGMNPNKFML
jgi:glycosyltransferase involved in cell wall biosynthesis